MPKRQRPISSAPSPRRTLAVAAIVVGSALVGVPAIAQDWRWPWETETREQRRQRPVAPRQQRPRPEAFQQRYGGQRASNVCLQLERRLANEVNRGRTGGDQRASLRQALRGHRQQERRLERQLESRDCWDEFFFQRTLRNTRVCVSTYRRLQRTRQAAQDTEAQLARSSSSNRQQLQNDLLLELARNRCGPAYEQQARRINRSNNPFAAFFEDEGRAIGGRQNNYRGLAFATYRTLCVRLCDGYYFPVSFSTLPNYFDRDAEACQQRCAAPTGLYYYQNPGSSIDQMVSVSDNSTYTQLNTAFKYRKEFVKGCSCKTEEYIPQGVA
ncbi:MAG: DUF2865 domain-containing protein, partial [Pseudomonadota bacterium]